VLASLVLVGIQQSRAAAHRAACANHLKEIGLGLASHQSTHGTFPPQAPAPNNSAGSPFSYEGIGWQVYILPFVGESVLWDVVGKAYRANPDPWSAPHQELMRTVIAIYTCPSDTRLATPLTDASGRIAAYTSYVGMTGNVVDPVSGVFGRRKGVSPAQITDGLSRTIMIGERPPPQSLSMGWWYTTHQFSNLMSATDYEVPASTGASPGDPGCGGDPVNWPGLGNTHLYFFKSGALQYDCDKNHYWSLHTGGANFLFADGSVRFMTYAGSIQVSQMASIAGAEVISD
jgi:prepilin-type processing-associated H-X9-DG protein